MNQHYLPRFYLKQFTTTGPERPGPFLWVLRNGQWIDRDWVDSIVRHTASADDFYGYGLDELLTNLENKIAPIFNKFCLSPGFLANEDKQILAIFMGLLQIRVPSFVGPNVESHRQLHQQLHWNQYAIWSQNPNSLLAFKEWLKSEKSIDVSDKTLEDFHPDNFDWQVPNGYVVNSALPAVKIVARLFCEMKWKLFQLKSPGFVTSDMPIASHSPEESLFSGGLADEEVEVTFPLSPTLALLCSYRGESDYSVVEPTVDEVRRINRRTINGASRFLVISASKSFPASDEVEKKLAEARLSDSRAKAAPSNTPRPS